MHRHGTQKCGISTQGRLPIGSLGHSHVNKACDLVSRQILTLLYGNVILLYLALRVTCGQVSYNTFAEISAELTLSLRRAT